MSHQINQPISRRHLFRIAFDVFSENRAENRLIHSALIQVANGVNLKLIKKQPENFALRLMRFQNLPTTKPILVCGVTVEI